MLSTIAKPFGLLVMWLYEITNNYGLAVILFALIVKLILLPFQVKSKRSTLRSTRLTPYVDDIKKRYAGNDAKINAETQKLYKEEGINPMSGCLWSLLPFPIIIALYQAIRFPLTIMMGVPKELLEEGGAILKKLTELGYESTMRAGYYQIGQAQFISNNMDKFAGITDKLRSIDFSFLGINLGATPKWNFLWTTDWSDKSVWLQGLGLFLIPIIAAALTLVSNKIAQKVTPQASGNPAAQNANTMLLMMPVVTLWFAFMMPASLGLYWIASTFFSIIQDLIVNKIMLKQMEAEDAERNARMAAREAEREEKRKETERLRAMNATVQNKNTSKRKQYIKEREAQEAKTAEWEKAHKQHKETEQPASQVGERKFARGRAYVAERFENKTDVEESAEDQAAAMTEENLDKLDAHIGEEPVSDYSDIDEESDDFDDLDEEEDDYEEEEEEDE